MNVLLADLQSEAWQRRIRLILDTTQPIRAAIPTATVAPALGALLQNLIALANPDAAISIVTSYEKNSDAADGALCIEISAPLNDHAYLDIAALREALVPNAGDVALHRSGTIVTVDVRVANALMLNASSPAPTALVVEDDLLMQNVLEFHLAMRGYRIIAVNDGFDALIVLERTRPDLVLTDMCMPNLDGLELMRRIKRTWPQIPVVIISGYPKTLARGVTDAAMPDAVLAKPFEDCELERTLEQLGLPSKAFDSMIQH